MRGVASILAGLLTIAFGFWLDLRMGRPGDWGPWWQFMLYFGGGGMVGYGSSRIVWLGRLHRMRRNTALLEQRLEKETLILQKLLEAMAPRTVDEAQQIAEDHTARVLVELKEEGVLTQRDIDEAFEQHVRRARMAERN